MKHYGSFISVINHLVDCLGSCIASCLRSQLDTSKEVRSQGLLGLENSDDSWTSTNSSFIDVKEQRFKRSNSRCKGIENDHSSFVNHGLILWNQIRHQWIGEKQQSQKQGQTKQPLFSWSKSYGTFSGMSKQLQQRAHVPLSEMVDCLVDIWDQEGLYD